jgi:hypothetical protein
LKVVGYTLVTLCYKYFSEDCGNPTPINGFTNSTKTNYGAAVHVSCDKDYMLDGNSDIICQINGEWTNKPSCKLIGN